MYQSLGTLPVGAIYQVSWKHHVISGGFTLRIDDSSGAVRVTQFPSDEFNRGIVESHTVYYVSQHAGTTYLFLIGLPSTASEFYVDDISVKQVTAGGTVAENAGMFGALTATTSTQIGTSGTSTATLRWNATASVADGGTISHGMGADPTMCLATGSVAGESITVTHDATNITVAIKKTNPSGYGVIAGTTQTINWACMK